MVAKGEEKEEQNEEEEVVVEVEEVEKEAGAVEEEEFKGEKEGVSFSCSIAFLGGMTVAVSITSKLAFLKVGEKEVEGGQREDGEGGKEEEEVPSFGLAILPLCRLRCQRSIDESTRQKFSNVKTSAGGNGRTTWPRLRCEARGLEEECVDGRNGSRR